MIVIFSFFCNLVAQTLLNLIPNKVLITSLLISKTSNFLGLSIQLFLPIKPVLTPPATVNCWPGLFQKKLVQLQKFLGLLLYPDFFLNEDIYLKNIDLLKTFKSLEIGFKIPISSDPWLNN